MKEWRRTFVNAFLSTFPVIAICLVLHLTNVTPLDKWSIIGESDPLNGNGIWLFLAGSILLFFGIAFFSIGTEHAMSKIGEHVGSSMTSNKNLILLAFIVFLLGLFVTIAEPDLSVLAAKIPVDDYLFIALVGIGVGIFLVLGVARILLQKSLKLWLLAFYALIFALVCLVDESFIPLTFDSGGVTTGPVTVPFILALGVGIATSRGGKNSNADSFGLTAFCSVGPLLIVLIFGLFTPNLTNKYEGFKVAVDGTLAKIIESLINSLANVSIAICPIIIFFFIYNAVVIHLPKKEILTIIVGLFYTYIGLILFLTGAEGGFTPIADLIGQTLVNKGTEWLWLLFLVAGLIGLVVVLCEPAVQVLVKQVEDVSDGLIKKRTMLIALSSGIAIGVVLAIVRIVFNFSIIYYVVPGYILALGLTFAVPDIYVGIAFDSGGVASGPMTSAFILPFAIGVAHRYYLMNSSSIKVSEGTFLMTRGFGTVAMVAMMPLIVIQLLGLTATIKQARILHLARKRIREENDNQIIHFGA